VLKRPVALLTVRIRTGGRPCLLLLGLLSNQRRDSVHLVLRLGVLERRSRGRIMVGREVQDMLLCFLVSQVVFDDRFSTTLSWDSANHAM
jgi:hypothetical protein